MSFPFPPGFAPIVDWSQSPSYLTLGCHHQKHINFFLDVFYTTQYGIEPTAFPLRRTAASGLNVTSFRG